MTGPNAANEPTGPSQPDEAIPPKTMRLSSEPSAVADAAPMLVVVEGLEPGRRHRLGDPATTIGRGAGNDVVLPSPAVSHEHARVLARDGQFWIEDLQSTNGVAVNGAAVRDGEPRPLSNGDAVRIADHLLLFHHAGAQRASSAATIAIDRAAVAQQVEELLKQAPGPRSP